MDYKTKEILKRAGMLAAVAAIVFLMIHPLMWITFGWIIIKILLLLLLATIVSRVAFKKSLTDLVFGDKDDDL